MEEATANWTKRQLCLSKSKDKHTTLDLLLATGVAGLCQSFALYRCTIGGLFVLMLMVVVIVVVVVMVLIVIVVIVVMVIVGTGFRRLPFLTGLCGRLCGFASLGHVSLL